MISRESYTDELIKYIDKPFVKVLTGIRRSGKSTILKLLRSELLKRNIKEEQIICLNFESFSWSQLSDATKLYEYIKEKLTTNLRYYIILDEVQEVDHWEQYVLSNQ